MSHSDYDSLCAVVAFVVTLGAAATASAHVEFRSPESGATLQPNSTITVEWEETIAHETNNWALDFSTTSGNWTAVAPDLPANARTYEWTVPDANCSDPCTLRLTQENVGRNYTDTVQLQINSSGSDAGPADATSRDAAGDVGAPEVGTDPDTAGGTTDTDSSNEDAGREPDSTSDNDAATGADTGPTPTPETDEVGRACSITGTTPEPGFMGLFLLALSVVVPLRPLTKK